MKVNILKLNIGTQCVAIMTHDTNWWFDTIFMIQTVLLRLTLIIATNI